MSVTTYTTLSSSILALAHHRAHSADGCAAQHLIPDTLPAAHKPHQPHHVHLVYLYQHSNIIYPALISIASKLYLKICLSKGPCAHAALHRYYDKIIIHSASADASADMPKKRLIKLMIIQKHSRML